jgi:hypothetical protein
MSKTASGFLILGSLFATTHIFALSASLYWYYDWFDICMHFWGGILIALGVKTLFELKLYPFAIRYKSVLLFGLSIMISWEIFESTYGSASDKFYLFDTIWDIVFGIIGMSVGYMLLKKR